MSAPTPTPAADAGLKLMKALAARFGPATVKWKPQMVKGDKALAICYLDARAVQQRLDEVFGVGGWQTEFKNLDGGSVECRLSVSIGGQWVVKTDVGSPSEQPDEGDRVKAAYSDAFKRAAVQLGVGRYLYSLPPQWVPYDAQKKRFAQAPVLPVWALPPQKEAA